MKIKRCEIRRNDLLAGVRIKESCHNRAEFVARIDGGEVFLRLCLVCVFEFRAAHPEITVDRLK